MIHPSTELRFVSEEIGTGVFATREIPAGTITWVLDKLDRIVPVAEFQAMDQDYQVVFDRYAFRNQRGDFILCWDLEKYVNHSFTPNTLLTPFWCDIAVRDIAKGEQITNDYGFLNILEPFEPRDEGHERKMVYPDDLLRYHQIWDAQINKVINRIPAQSQPLKRWLPSHRWQRILDTAEGRSSIPSVRTLYCGDDQP